MFLFTKTRGQRQYMSIIDQLLEGVFFFCFLEKYVQNYIFIELA